MEERKPSTWENVKSYFTDLYFYRDEMHLGSSDKVIWWTLLMYFLDTLGVFCRQITNFPKVSLNLSNLQWTVFFASLIFGFAILPLAIRKINLKKQDPSLVQVLSAFSIGFFMDFTTNIASKFLK